jgi:hypothetical protein
MTADPGAAGHPPPFGAGHRVVYLPSGETWTVDDYRPATAAHGPRLLLGRSSADGGVVRGTVMDVSPDDVRLVAIPGRPAWPPFASGDLVVDLLSDETWNVEQYEPAVDGRTAKVRLTRESPADGSACSATADARDLGLLLSWTERPVFPGDGWSARASANARHEPPDLARLGFPGPGPATGGPGASVRGGPLAPVSPSPRHGQAGSQARR